ncbi:MAG TPA: site-specific integrase [Gemmataceae bacterium]|nr:site-specific integrase [Gemmataceae bacterium]
MAALQERNGSFRLLFWFHRKQHTFTIGQVPEDEATATAATVGNLLRGIEEQRIRFPAGVDIVSFLRQRLAGLNRETDDTPEPQPQPRKQTTLGTLRDRYVSTHSNGTIEANSLDTVRLHFSHFCRSLGDGFPLHELSLLCLQEYIDGRARKGISPVTMRKEVATVRAAWNWGQPMGLTTGQFPARGLRYPKGKEKPAFMTRAQIEREIAAGHEEPAELWECLYLELPEIAELLGYVKDHASQPFIYPMIAFAAHTGARRSEMLRALVTDVDFTGSSVLVREKKRARGKQTTRRVPLTPSLAAVLKDWLAVHPGGKFLFCLGQELARSKKRSKTTGHKGEKTRSSSLKGRLAGVKARAERPAAAGLTKDEAHDHFKRTLAGGKWGVLRGYHILRHSFISACASRGVDQRLIDEWVGHTTEEMRKRYRHLYPSTQQDALKSVFG